MAKVRGQSTDDDWVVLAAPMQLSDIYICVHVFPVGIAQAVA
jgi:hypothetical protein